MPNAVFDNRRVLALMRVMSHFIHKIWSSHMEWKWYNFSIDTERLVLNIKIEFIVSIWMLFACDVSPSGPNQKWNLHLNWMMICDVCFSSLFSIFCSSSVSSPFSPGNERHCKC